MSYAFVFAIACVTWPCVCGGSFGGRRGVHAHDAHDAPADTNAHADTNANANGHGNGNGNGCFVDTVYLSLIHISEPTRPY